MGPEHPKVSFTGVKETMLATLYARAVQSAAPDPVLADPWAVEAVAALDYDFRRLGMRGSAPVSVATRAKTFDRLTLEMLTREPGASVLHLGCGLDSRAFRIGVPPDGAWYDVDYPDVVDLRRRLFDVPEGDYHLVGSSLADPSWPAEVPQDRPVAVVAEGVLPYLDEREVVALLRAIVGRFPSGETVFDALNRQARRLAPLHRTLRATGAVLRWAIEDPRELTVAVPGLVFTGALPMADPDDLARLPWPYRVLGRLPAVQRMARVLCYRFPAVRRSDGG
ncbi:class I SAM-dependent methyltransferase [Marinactinospora rubrisoli]|uniref:Class I SAM-dependent methyltransferase n=1 Tax=Marinactinospora rubrisoli TaxID=2715399 RepID=A0ABW2KJY0_9ACTN